MFWHFCTTFSTELNCPVVLCANLNNLRIQLKVVQCRVERGGSGRCMGQSLSPCPDMIYMASDSLFCTLKLYPTFYYISTRSLGAQLPVWPSWLHPTPWSITSRRLITEHTRTFDAVRWGKHYYDQPTRGFSIKLGCVSCPWSFWLQIFLLPCLWHLLCNQSEFLFHRTDRQSWRDHQCQRVIDRPDLGSQLLET